MVRSSPGHRLDKSAEVQPAIPSSGQPIPRQRPPFDPAKWASPKTTPSPPGRSSTGPGTLLRLRPPVDSMNQQVSEPRPIPNCSTIWQPGSGKWQWTPKPWSGTSSLSSLPPKFLPRGNPATDDPGNRYYARQSASAMPNSSGIRFVDQRTARTEDRGKSAQALQPAGYWQHLNFPAASGKPDKETISPLKPLHLCRSFHRAAMVALSQSVAKNAPSVRARHSPASPCTAERSRVRGSGQALAERLLKSEATDAQRLDLFLILTAFPTKQEQTILFELLAEQRKRNKTTRSPPSNFSPLSQAHRPILPAEFADEYLPPCSTFFSKQPPDSKNPCEPNEPWTLQPSSTVAAFSTKPPWGSE